VCFAAVAGDRVVGATWAAPGGAWCDYLEHLVQLPDDEVYLFDTMVAPGWRGQRVAARIASAQIRCYGERDIATAIPFNVRNVRDVVRSRAVAARRRQLDRALTVALGALFADATPPVMFPAGHWWYPAGSHLGWHTNERFPGWRLYLSHAEQPGASFFRYRDPHSAAIVTSPDDAWNVRLFEVSPERPLWHAVASDTNRHSIGWIVRPWSLRDAAALAVKRTLATLCG